MLKIVFVYPTKAVKERKKSYIFCLFFEVRKNIACNSFYVKGEVTSSFFSSLFWHQAWEYIIFVLITGAKRLLDVIKKIVFLLNLLMHDCPRECRA